MLLQRDFVFILMYGASNNSVLSPLCTCRKNIKPNCLHKRVNLT